MMRRLLIGSFGLFLMLASPLTLAGININKDDINTISKGLKGIGKARATAIVREREKNGPFKNEEDLAKRIKGIGKATLAKNKDNIRFK